MHSLPRSCIAFSLICVASVFSVSSATAQAGSAFHDFEGSWTGSGSLSHQDGSVERLRCSAEYATRGELLSQRLRCRSDTTGFDLVNTLQADGAGRVSGEWVETTRNARGSFSGRLSRGAIQGTGQGPGFTAAIAVAVRGPRQTVSIRAQGGDIAAVNIALARGR